eukprot:4164780-Alexandrium_andersonii.AAC.1
MPQLGGGGRFPGILGAFAQAFWAAGAESAEVAKSFARQPLVDPSTEGASSAPRANSCSWPDASR